MNLEDNTIYFENETEFYKAKSKYFENLCMKYKEVLEFFGRILKFYSDEKNWNSNHDVNLCNEIDDIDLEIIEKKRIGGKLAREVLGVK